MNPPGLPPAARQKQKPHHYDPGPYRQHLNVSGAIRSGEFFPDAP